jgi:Gpi18-like mannosyltransferase
MFFSPNNLLFILSVIYLSINYLLSLLFISEGKQGRITKNLRSVSLIFLLALGIRIIPVLFFPFGSGYDLSSFLWAGQRILNGEDIYWNLAIREHFAFLPTYGIISALFIQTGTYTHIPVVILMKLLIIFFDSLIAPLIFIACGNIRKAVIYCLSPIGIMIGAYFGQFDSIPLFFSLLGIIFYSQNMYFISMFILGIAFIFKPWPIIFILLIIAKNTKRKTIFPLIMASLIPVIISLFLYRLIIPAANFITMLGIITLYESSLGWWGLSIFFHWMAFHFHHIKILLIPAFFSKMVTIIVIVYQCFSCKKKSVFTTAKYIILSVYILSFGLGIQYLMWILPFALITKDNYLKKYLTFTGGYFILFGALRLLNYNFTPPGISDKLYISASFLLWVFFTSWGFHEFIVPTNKQTGGK